MTNEEKQLLLEVLCAQLPYGVKFTFTDGNIRIAKGIDLRVTDDGEWEYFVASKGASAVEITDVEPYLRPMSSMTDEEKEELKQEHIKDEKLYVECLTKAAKGDSSMRGKVIIHYAMDWCNKNHFDYRGLIEKGLALEAPEGMYKTE